jgi:hypothetical protein
VTETFLAGLSDSAIAALPHLFEFWAMDHQLPPEGDWKTWVILGGRGAGKTRAGAEWVRAEVEGARPEDAGRSRRVALVGETLDQVREVMVFGDSGLMACAPPDRRPKWEATRRRLVWPNGAVAQAFSASEPESLRGPQFDAVWADEIGCAAIDKATNQPNKFLDPKSSESAIPHFSDGRRDDLIQSQYLRALELHWSDPANNPVSPVYGGPMVDMSRAHVWAWDARPWPVFPNDTALWSDGGNYARGHWIQGRVSAPDLADVIAEICERAGLGDFDVSGVHGLLRGYEMDGTATARAALQPLLLAGRIDAAEREGLLRFATRGPAASPAATLDTGALALVPGEVEGLEQVRAAEAELSGRVHVAHVEAGGDYATRTAEAVFPDERGRGAEAVELPLALTAAEAAAAAERWLAEARVARDTLRFALPPSALSPGAGEIVALETGGAPRLFRIDRVEEAGARICEAVRVEPEVSRASDAAEALPPVRPFAAPAPVLPLYLDLPLITGEEVPHAPHVAVTATPWPGTAAVYSSASEEGYVLNRLVERAAVVGVTETPLLAASPGRWDRGALLKVRLGTGALAAAGGAEVLNGANLAAIGAGSGDGWELFQFAEATLTGPGLYEIGLRLRGQLGTEAAMPAEWPPGSWMVLIDAALVQIELAAAARGLVRHYRAGPAQRGPEDRVYTHEVLAFAGAGLRPYAPAHLRAAPDGAGGWTADWVRRTRIDGDSWQSVEVPLGEDREAYALRVRKHGAIRREAETAQPAWHYTAAAMAEDGVGPPFALEVAQLSGRYGPGPFRRIEIDG